MTALIQRLLLAIGYYPADWRLEGDHMVRLRNGQWERREATAADIDEANVDQAYRF